MSNEKYYDLADITPCSTENLSEQISYLKKMSINRSPSCRCDVARTLVDYSGNECEAILLRLLNDKNMLVRVEAADSLASYVSIPSFNALKSIIEHENYYLLKGYAISSFTQIGMYLNPMLTEEIICQVLRSDNRYFVRLFCFEGLYRLGDKTAINKIFCIFKSKNYRTRCAVISSLEQILDSENAEQIKLFIQQQFVTENEIAVRERLKDIISIITNN